MSAIALFLGLGEDIRGLSMANIVADGKTAFLFRQGELIINDGEIVSNGNKRPLCVARPYVFGIDTPV